MTFSSASGFWDSCEMVLHIVLYRFIPLPRAEFVTNLFATLSFSTVSFRIDLCSGLAQFAGNLSVVHANAEAHYRLI